MSDNDRFEEWCVDVVVEIGIIMAREGLEFTPDAMPQHGQDSHEYLEEQAGVEPLDAFELGDSPEEYAEHFVQEAIEYENAKPKVVH